MNTVLSRLNTMFAFALTVLASLTFLLFLSTAFFDHKADVKISTGQIVVKNIADFTTDKLKRDLAIVNFDLSGDLQQLFNWNVKQLFLYLTAEYTTKDNAINQVVLWDKIIKRGENAKLNVKGANSKYYFFDDGKGLRANENVTFSLSWQIIPNAGGLPRIVGGGLLHTAFPSEYTGVKY